MSNPFVLVEGGTFNMGSNDSRDEKPIHEVTLDSFEMAKYTITVGEWKEFLIEKGEPFEWKTNSYGLNPVRQYSPTDKNPIINVNFAQIMKFCAWFNQKYNSPEPYDANGDIINWKSFRLPTEAEWEYAARGGNKSEGYKYAGSNNLDEVACYYENSGVLYMKDITKYRTVTKYREVKKGFLIKKIEKEEYTEEEAYIVQEKTEDFDKGKTLPVGSKKANELGLYDMSGNIWEWCSDWHDEKYYECSPAKNPYNKDKKEHYRVLRGGSWRDSEVCQKVTYRRRFSPDFYSRLVGFRLVRSI